MKIMNVMNGENYYEVIMLEMSVIIMLTIII